MWWSLLASRVVKGLALRLISSSLTSALLVGLGLAGRMIEARLGRTSVLPSLSRSTFGKLCTGRRNSLNNSLARLLVDRFAATTIGRSLEQALRDPRLMQLGSCSLLRVKVS
jgi:hypothetical protein